MLGFLSILFRVISKEKKETAYNKNAILSIFRGMVNSLSLEVYYLGRPIQSTSVTYPCANETLSTSFNRSRGAYH